MKRKKLYAIYLLLASLLMNTGYKEKDNSFNSNNIVNEDETKIKELIITLQDMGFSYDDEVLMYLYTSSKIIEVPETVELLEVEKNIFDLYPYLDNKIIHTNHELYDKEKNDIKWDLLFNVIKKNNSSYLKTKFLTTSSNKVVKYSEFFTSLEDEKIQDIVNDLKEYYYYIKEKYEDYDVEKFACTLSSLSLFYNSSKEVSSSNIIAFCLDETSIVWNTSGRDKEKIFNDLVTYHELGHKLAGACSDEVKSSSLALKVGLGIYSKIPYDNKKNNILSMNFIIESLVEKNAALYLNQNVDHYEDNIEVTEMIEFVLSMNDNYKMNDISKDNFCRDPLSFINRFQIVSNQNEIASLVQINNMLASYNTLFSIKNELSDSFDLYLRNGYKKDDKNIVYTVLLDYSDEVLYNLFTENLIIMNENNQDEMTLEDSLSYLVVFDYSFSRVRNRMSIGDATKLPEEARDNLLDYLSYHYDMDIEEIVKIYNGIYSSGKVSFPEFVDNDEKDFYLSKAPTYFKLENNKVLTK